MRTKLRGKVTLLLIVCAALLAVSAVAAIADELRSSHNTFTATVRNLSLLTGGATDTVSVRLNQDNSDGDTQCNVDAGETLTIKAVSSNASAATVKWADNNSDTISFVGCQGNDNRNLTVTSGSAGTANITFSIVTNTTGVGTYDLTSKAPFTVTVAPPPNTPPQVQVTGVADGASYEKGAVPAAGCTVTDAEDSNESASPVVDSSGLNSFGLGLETVTCSYTDQGGLNTTARATYTIQDTTPPSIAPHGPVTANATSANGAVVNYTNPTANDSVYGSVGVTCSPASGSTFPLGTTQVTCTATDGSGNTATSNFNVIVSDATAPVITHTVSGQQGNNDWYTGDVNVDWTVSEPESPNSLQTTGCADFNVTSDQDSTTYTCSATSAGGQSSASVTIKRDAAAPNVQCGSADGNWHGDNVDIACTATDGGSGLANSGDGSFNLSTSVADGSETATADTNSRNVADNAGNSATAGPVSGNKVDRKAPNVQCGSADGNWHANDVSIACTATDGGSGLANSGDGSFNLSTSVADGSETATADTNSRNVADAVGHSATAGPISGNKVDRKAPTFDACPTAGPFTQGSTQSVSINATDGGSGLDAANSTLTRSVDTTNIGNTSVTFTAKDNVANSGTKTCTYDVDYKWDGFFQPIDNKDTSGNFIINKAKLGSTVPVKFSLGGDKGLNIFASGYPQVSAAVTCSPSSSTDALEEYATATVSSLKYDSTANQYIYNWKTDPKYTVGTCRQLIVKLADGTEHRATFSFFK